MSKETGLLKTWPDGGPKLLWTFRDAGAGYSGPAVVGATLYSMGADGKTEYLYALDTKTLKKAWTAEIGPVFKDGHGDGPRGTPTVDGDFVYGLGAQGELVCVDGGSGGVVWRKNLKTDLGGEMWSEWGYSESPLVDGDLVVCTPGGKNGTLAALDKKTGAVRWRSKDWTDKAAYSSVVAAEVGGVRHVRADDRRERGRRRGRRRPAAVALPAQRPDSPGADAHRGRRPRLRHAPATGPAACCCG